MKPIPIITMILALAACGPADNDPGPGGVTIGEARALDEAAEMLESRRIPPEDILTEPTAAAPADRNPQAGPTAD